MSSATSPLIVKTDNSFNNNSNNNVDKKNSSTTRRVLIALGITLITIIGFIAYKYMGNANNNGVNIVNNIDDGFEQPGGNGNYHDEPGFNGIHKMEEDGSSSSSSTVRPNIIYILMDDMGYGDISARGAEFNTPNLDELYDNSIVINNHYIGLVCSPTRSQLITGRYAWNMGLSSQTAFSAVSMTAFPSALPTLGNLLSDYSDYITYFTGKWHMGYPTTSHTPLGRGFTKFSGFYSTELRYSDKCVEDDNWDERYIDWRNEDDIDYDTQYLPSTFVTATYMDQYIYEHIQSYGNDVTSDDYKPFYLHVPFQAVHPTLETMQSENMANCEVIELEESSSDVDSDDSDAGTWAFNERVLMCQNIMAIDQVVGELMDNLKNQYNIWDNTMIVFTSDNGGNYNMGACNYPLRGGKDTWFEGSIKTLNFVGGGYIDSSQYGERDEFMHVADWTPTILGLAGVDVDYVSEELQNKLYIPAAKAVSIEQHETDTYYRNYLMENSFDGQDVSQWLLYGSDNINYQRDVMFLSVNNLYEEDSGPQNSLSLVFNSVTTGHTYKLIYLKDVQNSHNIEWCQYDSETTQRTYTKPSKKKWVQTNAHLYDLTIEPTENNNLMLVYKNTESKYNIVWGDNSDDKSVGASSVLISNDDNGMKKRYTHDIVSQVWDEGISYIRDEIDSNPLFNERLTCHTGLMTNDVSPPDHDNAYGPFFTFDEYKQNFGIMCKQSSVPLLYHMYTTKWDDY